ncbi:MAG: sigma-54 dependent transcriptional regulator, partial [Bacteroidales bacterium]
MMNEGKILVIDDDQDILLTTKVILKKEFSEIKTVTSPDDVIPFIEKDIFDVILLDMNFTTGATSGKEGLSWLKKILEISPEAIIIVMTAYGDINLAVEAMKIGATDFIIKPWENKKFIATVNSAFKLSRSKKEINLLKTKQETLAKDIDQPFTKIIGNSDAIAYLYKTIDKVADTDANILILGENGTGKELVAREIHRKSRRAKNLFMSVDLGAIPETLFESELFGHVKGAFTDAKEDRNGRFAVANGGTLFLDEIGNLTMPLQAKLLTAIQNHKITPVGSNTPVKTDIRLICATNMPLLDMIEKNQFRQDLFFRINTVEIHLPPLRDRL